MALVLVLVWLHAASYPSQLLESDFYLENLINDTKLKAALPTLRHAACTDGIPVHKEAILSNKKHEKKQTILFETQLTNTFLPAHISRKKVFLYL